VTAQQAPDGAERRRAPRFEPEELAESVFVVGSRLVNIGALGLMLEAPVPLPSDSRLELRLVIGGEKGDVRGRVRGCVPRSLGRTPAWGIGVEFEDMTPSVRERLSRALVPWRRPGRA
jgi:hypothetical protein